MAGDPATSVAILADIHGNIVALDAVLEAVRAEGIGRIVVPGDLAWGPQPREVVDRIRGLPEATTVIRGNADREVADPETVVGDAFLRESTAWCAARLTDGQRHWLDRLPLTASVTASVTVDGLGEVLVCHGSPRSDTEGMRPDTDPELIATWLAGVTEPVVVCGHTHVQFERTVGRHRIVNPGSVGLHYGAPGAQWAILGPDVAFRTTPYDRERAVALAETGGIPGADGFAAFLRDPVGAS